MTQGQIENTILSYLQPYNLRKIGLFGSYVRNESQPESDLDIMVEFKNPPSLLKLVSIENGLSRKLGVKVDLVTFNAIKNRRIKSQIDSEIIMLLDA